MFADYLALPADVLGEQIHISTEVPFLHDRGLRDLLTVD